MNFAILGMFGVFISYMFRLCTCNFGGGGSSGGGGGGSGEVSYPNYMETVHNDWLDNTGVDTITSSITDVMDTALGNSPWAAQAAYDPDTDITAMIAAEDLLQDLVDLLSTGTTLDTLISNVLDETRIDDLVDEYEADAAARLAATILPRFRRGMQDINAVVSSAFAIGEAVIEAEQERNVNKFSAELHMKTGLDAAIQVIQMKLEYQRIASAMLTEIYRMKIVAKKEENETEMKIDESDALWDLEVFQYGANLLAGIGGGTSNPNTKQPSMAQSVIGGAMSGAAAGGMMGSAIGGSVMGMGAGPFGMIAGGVLGAASALL